MTGGQVIEVANFTVFTVYTKTLRCKHVTVTSSYKVFC
jgi:hypothetical protein